MKILDYCNKEYAIVTISVNDLVKKRRGTKKQHSSITSYQY